MPAERSRTTARKTKGAQATQLVWAVDSSASLSIPAAAPTDSSIAFANITPTCFEITSGLSSPISFDGSVYGDELPPLVDPPATSEFQLFPPAGEDNLSISSSNSKRTPHSKKKPENHIPRPPNAFILFRSSFIKSQHVSAEVETNHSTLSKIIGMTWQNLPEDERQAWHAKARTALAEHKRKFPKYTFRPTQGKAKCKGGTGDSRQEGGNKRRVREVEPKDLKRCAKIAELLVEGKKGAELDAAIQEFDRHHVPEIVTRFEAPITARAFRRSSSAPIPETENSRKSQTFLPNSPVLQPKDGMRKMPRATSIQPTRCSTPKDDREELIAATLKQEPSMDFSSFSFANMNHQPAHPFDCDPLSPVSPAQTSGLLHINDTYTAPSPLSITNFPSFLMDSMDEWSPVTPYMQSNPFSYDISSPGINPFDSHCGFDTFDASHSQQQQQHGIHGELYAVDVPTTDFSALSLGNSHGQSEYDLNAGVGIGMLDMSMDSIHMGGLITGYEGAEFMDLLGQQTHSTCNSQQQQNPNQMPQQQHLTNQNPNLDYDLTTALMPPSLSLSSPTDFVM